jgi:T5SS/PEP-CTERM-associated repeat protein/autotransporter-associated beta strand protein
MSIGYMGTGTLNIQNGAAVSNGNANIGGSSGTSPLGIPTGTVNVSGGSTWTSSGTLYVSYTGIGTLNVTSGTVSATGAGIDTFIAGGVGSAGTATIDGASSKFSIIKNLYVGYATSNGKLEIKNGGIVSDVIGYVGAYSGGTGSVTVTGGGSTWTNTGALVVGVGGSTTSTVDVRNGGAMTSVGGSIGTNVGGSAIVTVDGAGSTWTSGTGTVTVGYAGSLTGTVNITGGGKVVANALTGSTLSTSAMNVNFDNGTLQASATNPAWFTKGSGTANVLIREGGATFDTGVYNVGANVALLHGGTATSDGGLTKIGSGTLTMTLSGANTYTGPTNVNVGTLSLDQPCLYNAGNVRIDSGAVLNLTYVDTDTVRFLFLGGIPQAAGVYNSANSSGYITGSGSLLVSYSVLPGDANADGTVNGSDLNTVLSDYNQTGMDWWHGDFDGNGTVNGTDLNTVLSNYNQSVSVSAGAAVPEPSTLLLAAAGLLGLLAYLWQRRT